MQAINYDKPGHTNVIVKAKFYMVRMLQTSLGKQNPEYTDFKYWNENGWIGKARPWKQVKSDVSSSTDNIFMRYAPYCGQHKPDISQHSESRLLIIPDRIEPVQTKEGTDWTG